MTPFMTWRGRDTPTTIPNIRRMNFAIKWHENARNLIFHTDLDETAFPDSPDSLRLRWWQDPVMHLKWVVTPASTSIPRSLSIPMKWYETVTRPLPDTHTQPVDQLFTEEKEIEFNNIRLRGVPTMMFFWLGVAKDAVNSPGFIPAEKHLEITEFEFAIDGKEGGGRRMSSGELFAAYVRNSPASGERVFKYHQWRKRYCVLALTAADLGIDQVGAGGPICIVRLRYRGWWNFPLVGPWDDRDGEDHMILEFDADPVQYVFRMCNQYAYSLDLRKKDARLDRGGS